MDKFVQHIILNCFFFATRKYGILNIPATFLWNFAISYFFASFTVPTYTCIIHNILFNYVYITNKSRIMY